MTRSEVTNEKRYECTVTVNAVFIPEQSDVEQNQYAFAYYVKIINTGNISAQLISRHWIITEANGVIKEVKGLGVIGEQPLLKPDEFFEYTSGTVTNTPVGQMQGTYQMVAEDGVKFDAIIQPFVLAMPRVLH
jgi:ApaG protein